MRRPCPHGACDGTGLVVDEAEDVIRPCRCRERVVAGLRTRSLSAVIPKRFRGLSFDRPPVSELDPRIVREVQRYAQRIDQHLDRGQGMWFTGSVGTGKTTLAMLICSAALEARRSVAIYSLPRLLAAIRSTYEDASTESYTELVDKLTSVDLLHIDDLGFKKTRYLEKRTDEGGTALERESVLAEMTAWVVEQLYSVVNTRWEDQRALTVTTNLAPHELRDQIGERTVSRIVEICGDPLPLFGADRRVALRSA